MPQPPKINWDDLPDIDLNVPDSGTEEFKPNALEKLILNQPQVEEPSLWQRISQPLTDAPSRWASSIASSIDEPSLFTSPTGQGGIGDYFAGAAARAKGFGAGALEGIGDLVSGLTSPINLATTVLTAGQGTALKMGLPRIAQIASLGAKGAGALTAAHGAGNILSPESTLAERGMGLTEVAGGILGMRGPSKSTKIPKGWAPEDLKSKASMLGDDIGLVDDNTILPENFGKPKAPEVNLDVPDMDLNETSFLPKGQATPERVKQLRSEGYRFIGLDEEGDFRFVRDEPPSKQPVLESEVGQTRPKLGPVIDEKKTNPLVEAFNLPRALMASVDFSAPLRQGLPLIHKKEFWTALKPMFVSWASEKGFTENQRAIAQRPLYKPRLDGKGNEIPSFAEEAGLKLSDLTTLNNREESIMSTWAEKVPGVRRSNRAYTAFLNNLRADTFESLINDSKVFGVNAEADIPLARALADFVNTASGRGSLGKLESSAVALNSVLFSPRLIASRLKMLNPAYYVMAPPQVRKEALKSLFAIAAVGNTVTQLGRMAGGTVEMDPASSDFGKLKIGNTRIDPYGGFQQYIVAANRLLNPIPGMGQRVKSSTTGKEFDLWNPQKPFDPTHASVAGRFVQGKLHPTLAFAWNLFNGAKEMSGEPMNFTTTNPFENAIAQRFIPILLQDIYETSQENPKLLPVTVPLSTFGMSTQSYGQ